MENYYTEMIEEIESLIRNEEYEEADLIIKKELQMPYIPLDIEEKLNDLKKDIQYARSEKQVRREIGMDIVLQKLHGTPEEQLSAVENLCSRNLRNCVDEIQEYLEHEPNLEAASLLIDAIASQEVGDEFTYSKDGVEYTFWGDAVTPVGKCEGLKEALHFLYEWLGLKYPSIYEMAKKMLIHEVYVALPLTYEKGEGKVLAYEIAENLLTMMGEEELLFSVRNSMKPDFEA